MLQVTEYPVTDGKVKQQPTSKYELPKSQTARWKNSQDVEFYYQNLSKKTLDLNGVDEPKEGLSTSSAALDASADLVDREVQTDIDGVHYKVTSKYIQGTKVRVPSAKEKTEEKELIRRRRSSAYGRSTLAIHSRRAHLFHKSGQEGPSFLVSVPSLDGIVMEYEKMIDVDAPAPPLPTAKSRDAFTDASHPIENPPKTGRRKKMEDTVSAKQLNVESERDGDSDSDHVSPRTEGVAFEAGTHNDDPQKQPYKLHPFDGLKRREVQSARVRSAADSSRKNDVMSCEHQIRRPRTATHGSSNPNRFSPNSNDFFVPKNAWVNRVPSAASRATTPTIPHKQRHVTTKKEFDRPQFIVASKIRPQIENITKDGKYKRHIAGGSNYMQLIKHIRRPMTAPSSMPSSKFIQDSDSTSTISDVIDEDPGKNCSTKHGKHTLEKTRRSNRNPKGLDCVEPPKTRLHISTKQEILKVYKRNTAEDKEVMLRLDKEGYKASLEWRRKQLNEGGTGEPLDTDQVHILSEEDANATNHKPAIESDTDRQRKSAPEIFLPDSNATSAKEKLDPGAEREEFDPKKLFRYSPRMVVDYRYPPCHHANGPYGLKYWIDEITRRLNKKQKEAQKNKKKKPKVSKPKTPVRRITHSQITTDQINRVEANLNQLLRETTQIEMSEKRLGKSGMDQQTRDELLFLNMMDNLSMR